MPVVLSVLFSLRLCHKIERDSGTLFRLLTYLCALGGFYPQYLACRCFIICEVTALEVPMLCKKSEKLTQEPLQSLLFISCKETEQRTKMEHFKVQEVSDLAD